MQKGNTMKPAQFEAQEPVAWMFQHEETGRMNYVSNDGIHDPTMFLGMNPRYALVCPLYTTPQQIEVGCAECGANGNFALYCVTCAEKFVGGYKDSSWVGLTQTQVKLLWEGVQEEAVKSGDSLNWVFYTHINEALKEKNT